MGRHVEVSAFLSEESEARILRHVKDVALRAVVLVATSNPVGGLVQRERFPVGLGVDLECLSVFVPKDLWRVDVRVRLDRTVAVGPREGGCEGERESRERGAGGAENPHEPLLEW